MPLPQPADLTSLVLRTDFSDEEAWEILQAEVNASAEYPCATYVSDPAYAGVSIQAGSMSVYVQNAKHAGVSRPIRIGIILTIAAVIISVFSIINTSPASANTPSTWSGKVSGTSITFGWTNNHAWVISDYADAIAYGAGFVAGQLCAALMREEGPMIGKACGGPVTSLVKRALQGRPRLTNHGLWAAFYVWPEHEAWGTW